MKKLLVVLSLVLLIGITVSINAEVTEIPLEDITEIAIRNARALWDDVTVGEITPYYYSDGEIVAYRFNFIKGTDFPAKADLLDALSARETNHDAPDPLIENEFCTMLVSARRDMPVILEHSETLSHEYLLGTKLHSIAEKELGIGYKQERAYYITTANVWYCVSNEDEKKYIRVLPPQKVLEEKEFSEFAASFNFFCDQQDFSEDWSAFESGERVLDRSQVLLVNHEYMPFYPWHYGCGPTAAGMLLAWFDYNSINTHHNYAKLVDFYFTDWDDNSSNPHYDFHVANTLYQLKEEMDTNSSGSTLCSNMVSGTVDVTNDLNDYDFVGASYYNDHSTTWYFNYINDFVDDGLPIMLWINENHFVTAMGYNETNNMIAIHDPNVATIDWISKSIIDGVFAIWPDGGFGNALNLQYPHGDQRRMQSGSGNDREVYEGGDVYEIHWLSDTTTGYGKTVSIICDKDSENHDLMLIAENLPNNGYHCWQVPNNIDSENCRIWIELYDEYGTLIGADGSYGDITIQPGGSFEELTYDDTEITESDPDFYWFDHYENNWGIVGVRSNEVTDNWGITLFDDTSFSQVITESQDYAGNTNFIVLDGNHLTSTEHGVRVAHYDNETTTDMAKVEMEGDSGENLTVGTNPVETWPAGDVAEIWDVYLTPGVYTINLDVTSGNANLNLGIFSSSPGYYIKPMNQMLGDSSNHGPGEDETMTITISQTDYYGVCVWAVNNDTAQFQIDFDSPGEWIGIENSIWENADNWASGIIPDRYTNVLIPAGTPHSPRIYGGMAGITKGLTIAEGASLEVASGTLDVYATANIYGSLEVSQDDSEIEFKGHIRMYENSHFYDSGSASITVNGSWTADAGADIDFDQCTIYFVGAETTMLNIYSNTQEFHHFQVIKDTGRELIFGSTSTNNLVINGQLYIGSNATFRILNENPILTKSTVSSYGILEFEMGELIFGGSGSRYARFSSQDEIYAFRIQNGCTVNMVTTMHLKGYLSIDGGTLNAYNHDISTESGWSNTGGTFNPGGATVTFNGSGNNQYVDEDGFDGLHLSKFGGGDLLINNGKSVTCDSFEWTRGNIRVNNGSFTANDLADVRVMGRYYLDGGTIDLHQGTTPSEYVDLDADIWIYDGTFNIHGGYDYPSEWASAGAITVYMEDGILDFKDNGILLSDTGHYINDVITGGTIRTSGDFRVDRNGFYPAGGSIEMYGNGTAYLHTNSGSSFLNVNINKGSTRQNRTGREDRFNRVIIDEDTTIDQNMIVNNGFIQLSSATLTIGQDLHLYGGLNMDAADEIIEVGDDVTWFNGSGATVTDGEFHVNGDWLFYNGIDCEFEADNTVYFEGDENSIIYSYSDVATFGNIEVDKESASCDIHDYNSSTVQLSGDLNITIDNVFDVNGNELDVVGAIDIYNNAELIVDSGADVTTGEFFMQGEMTMNDGDFTITDNFIQYSSGEMTINNGNFIIDNPYEGSMESFSGTTILNNGNFQITNNGIQFGVADFQHNGGTIKIGWGFRAVSSGIFQQDTGAIEFIGNRSATINMGSNNWFNDIVINKDNLSNQVTLMNDCVINNDLTVNGGVLKTNGNYFRIDNDVSIGAEGRLDSDSGLIIVTGDWENLRGLDGFYEENGTVRFIGSSVSEISTDETFYDLVLQKTTGSMYYSQVATGKAVTVENDFNINDGKLLLNENCTLDVDQDLKLQDDTALRVSIGAAGVNIFIGHHLYDFNTDNADYTSFIPENSTVTFDGSLNQICQFARSSYDFHNLIIDQTADYFYPYNNLVVSGDMSVIDGCWNNTSMGMTHTFQGDVNIGDNSWNSNMGNVVFSGAEEASYQKGSGVVHHNVTIDKTGSRDAETLTLLTDLLMLWEGDLIINSGTLDANGNTLSCSGDVTINGGKLALDDNSRLRVGNAKSLSVNSGGTLESIGSAGNEADITCYNAGNYHDVHINANGTISAEHTTFQYMSADGVYVKFGSIVDPSHAFNYCTFQEGEPESDTNSYLLQFRNEQDLTMSYPIFPTNTWNSSYNIRKANNAGSIEVVEASGDFAGESYDLDPYNRVNWTSGPSISVTPSSQDFGDVIVGQSGRSGFYIENDGGATLVGTITTPTGFTVLPDSRETGGRNVINYSVDAGDTDTILLDFEPTEIQTYSGDVIITHNAGGPDETVFLTGNGIDAPPPEIEASPDTLNFGDLIPGEADTLWINIYNSGGNNLIGTITTPTGFTVSEYSWRNTSSEAEIVSNSGNNRNTLNYDIPAGYMFDYEVVFEPTALHDYTDDIIITHNAAGDDVPILCIGRGAEAVLTIDPVTMNKTLISGGTDSEILMLGNAGNLDLEYIAYIEYEGAANLITESFEGNFPPAGWSLQTFDTRGNWTQSYYYAYAGNYSAQASNMEVNDARLITPLFTATEDCILKFWVSANESMIPGENIGEFRIEVSTDSTNWTTVQSYDQEDLPYGFELEYVTLGQYAGQNIQVAFRVYDNYSGCGVNVDEVTIRGDSDPESWLSLNSGTSVSGDILVGAPDENIQVDFDAAGLTDGNYFAYIRTISNDTTDPEYNIQVSMDVGVYEMTLSTQLLEFGDVNVGESDSLQFTIENTGTLVLDGTIFSPDGYSVAENFSRDSGNRDVLYYHIFPGNDFTYDVTFEPPTYGNYNDNITIVHNMGGADELISVTGVGKAPEIVVSPDFLMQEQQPDVINNQDLTINNNGNDDLNYSASILYYSRSRDVIVSSGFEEVNFPPTGWTSEIVSGGSDWMQDGMYPYEGMYCAWADGYMIEDARLISPSFLAADNTQLSYFIKTDEWAMYGGSFGVEVSTDGTNWSFLDEIDISTLTDIYEQKVLSLSAYDGTNIQIAFRLYDNEMYSSDAIFIDNVEIGSGPAPTDQWLSLDGESTAEGTVEPGRTADIISVGFDSSGLPVGYYMADIIIDSNDPQMPQYTVMAELNVGYPQISVYPDSIGFGPIEVGEEFTNFFTIENTSSGTMTIFGTITTPSGYTVSEQVVRNDNPRRVNSSYRNTFNYEIISGGSQQFDLTFAPTETGEYNGNMVITHNAEGNDVLIEVTGTGADSPVVTTSDVTNITIDSATCGGNVTNEGGSNVYSRGVCWSELEDPTIFDNVNYEGSGVGSFVSEIDSLTAGITYYVRAFAENFYGLSYGNQVSFSTVGATIIVSPDSLPDFGEIAVDATSSEQSYTVSGENLESDIEIFAPTGFEISLTTGRASSRSNEPDVSKRFNSSRDFSESIILTPVSGTVTQTTIYVRFQPSSAVQYSESISHISANAPGIIVEVSGDGIEQPEVTTNPITDIEANSATGGGEVTYDGNSNISVRGVCWSTSSSPTIADSLTEDGTGSGEFTSSLINLEYDTLYYVRAYATNSLTTIYGNEVSFTTAAPAIFVSYSELTDFGDVVINTQSAEQSYYLLGYDLVENLEINAPTGFEISLTSETRNFGSQISLTPVDGDIAQTTIYIRFSPTTEGSYSGNITHESSGAVTKNVAVSGTGITTPTVTTDTITNIGETTATGGGNVTADGNSAVSARGVCWSESADPTIADDHTSDGTGTGTFVSSLTGLDPDTHYYVRAYATNAAGTVYGDEVEFNTITSTPPDPPANLTIEIVGENVVLNWDSVTDADSYKIYSSDDPDEPYVSWDYEDEVTGTTWSQTIPDDKKFYYVTSVRNP